MANSKILNRTPVNPQPVRVCPRCGKEHRSYHPAADPSARRLCDACYRKYIEECRQKEKENNA